MPDPKPSRKQRASRPAARPKKGRTPDEVRRAILEQIGSDEERVGAALKKMDAHAGADVVRRLGHQLGNVAVHRVLAHAAPVSIVGGGRLSETSRKVLEMILRAAGVRRAEIVDTSRTKGLEIVELVVSTGNPTGLVQAAEAEVGKALACFNRTAAGSAYHFEINQ